MIGGSKKWVVFLEDCQISMEGLFLNVDAAFNCKSLRSFCNQYGIILNAADNPRNSSQLQEDDMYFDDLMYKERYKIERTNAWMDSYRSLLNRFDTTFASWNAWHHLYALVSWSKFLQKV